MENLYIYIVLFILISVLLTFGIYIVKMSPLAAFSFSKKKIRWKVIIKYWGIIQAFTLFCHSIYDIILLPLLIVYLLIVYAMFYFKYPHYEDFKNKEFEDFKKSFERDKKLEKLI